MARGPADDDLEAVLNRGGRLRPLVDFAFLK